MSATASSARATSAAASEDAAKSGPRDKSGPRRRPSNNNSGSGQKKKGEEVKVVTTILGARKSEDVLPALLHLQEAAPSVATPSKGGGATSKATPSSSKVKEKPRAAPEAIQLVRPPTDTRDASVEAVNVLDIRSHELARELTSVERALIPGNTVFRVFGALGSNKSGRSSSLMATLTTTRLGAESKFTSSGKNKSALEVFVEPTRRIILVDFPAVCSSSNSKRALEPPVFAPQYRDVEKLYDLRVAFTALITCSVVLVTVVTESEENDPVFLLVKAASAMVKARGWPLADVILVRNMVPPGQSSNMRRVQADERTIAAILPEGASTRVVHIPQMEENEKETLEAHRRLARMVLSSFASTSSSVPTPSKVLARCTENDWLSSLVFVFGETRTQPFFIAGEEVGYLR